MSKPNTSGMPGMGAMADTFDFMKNLWGGMSMPGLPGMKLPGMVMPTLSVDEINKQIKDLKSVESWLTMNLNLLRGSIQALEVQSATITTIQSMSTSLASAMKPTSKPEPTAKTAQPGKPIFDSPFTASAAKPQSEPAPAAAAPNASAEPDSRYASEATAKSATTSDSAPLIPPMANPAAWWGMLQDQFKQAVDTAAAMAPEMPPAPVAKPAPAAKAAQPSKPKATKADKSAPAKAPAKRKAAPKA